MARDEAYRRAEQKIEVARRAWTAKLDLSGMQLNELPDSLGRLAQLRSLSLSSN